MCLFTYANVRKFFVYLFKLATSHVDILEIIRTMKMNAIVSNHQHNKPDENEEKEEKIMICLKI